MRGTDLGAPESLRFGSLEIDLAARSVRLRGRSIELTSSEFDLLWLFARHAGTVLSRNDILNELRSLEYDGSDRSVDCRVYRLRRKLGDFAADAQRIKTIRGVGYLFAAPAARLN
jgi:DNA-binding response OmpR family regulator